MAEYITKEQYKMLDDHGNLNGFCIDGVDICMEQVLDVDEMAYKLCVSTHGLYIERTIYIYDNIRPSVKFMCDQVNRMIYILINAVNKHTNIKENKNGDI